MEKCCLGCGLEGKYRYKNGKYYCNLITNKCPAKRKRDSDKKKGKKPVDRNGNWIWDSCKDEHPWNYNKTYEELLGEEGAKELKKKINNNRKNKPTGIANTVEKEKIRRQLISDSIKKRYENGWMPKAGRCKKIKYFSTICGEILLDGSWELLFAKWLDKNVINWIRNKNRFSYYFDEKDRFYTPDFYIKDFDLYVEVKGYETEKDRSKWKQFPYKLKVIKEDQIKLLKNNNFKLDELYK